MYVEIIFLDKYFPTQNSALNSLLAKPSNMYRSCYKLVMQTNEFVKEHLVNITECHSVICRPLQCILPKHRTLMKFGGWRYFTNYNALLNTKDELSIALITLQKFFWFSLLWSLTANEEPVLIKLSLFCGVIKVKTSFL